MQRYGSQKQRGKPNIKSTYYVCVVIFYIAQKQAKITIGAGSPHSSYPGGEGGEGARRLLGNWGADLSTSYSCLVSANSTYILMNCTLVSMWFFFLKVTSHPSAGDYYPFDVWTQEHLTSCGGSRRSRSHSGWEKPRSLATLLKLKLLLPELYIR